MCNHVGAVGYATDFVKKDWGKRADCHALVCVYAVLHHAGFFVWTRKEVFIQQIDYDKKFVQDCMSKLKAFYFDEVLVALTAEVSLRILQ